MHGRVAMSEQAAQTDHVPKQSAVDYLLEALERLDASEMRACDLEHALTHSRSIGMAMGVLMAMEKVTQAEAFDRLREASMRQNRKLYVVAEEVVERGAL
jgi:AmiR/NasT family two-component response regulator